MTRTFKILFFLFLIGPAFCFAGNLWGIDYYAFTVKTNEPVQFQNGIFSKVNNLQGHFWGGCFNIPVSRNAALSFGMGMNELNYQKEIQGIFPETGSYGFISVNGAARYWTFPVSFSCVQSRNKYSSSIYHSGIRIIYVPNFKNNDRISVDAIGGATQSSSYLNYKSEVLNFQHSVLISITNQVFIGSKGKLCIDPYIGFGSGYFKNETQFISNMSYGLRLSLQFMLPHISFAVEHHTDPKDLERKKLLEQKQKEIEEQLKNKPKQ